MSIPPSGPDVAFGGLLERAVSDPHQVDPVVESIVADLSLDERLAMMSGDLDFWPGLVAMLSGGYGHTPYIGGAVERVGLPGIRFTDGPRGVTLGHSTCFPVSMARGATWDADLEERVGEAMGAEARAQGANLLGSVCINLLYHPAWGRAQETYGEDPSHVGELGAAAVRGIQRHVMACVKHFALNNMENARFQVDVTAAPRVLQEVYLPHFHRCVDEGAACIMSAYNSVNGEWCGHNRTLLTDILRNRWGFDGFVITDWLYGMRDAEAAANAGVDVEMPFRMHYAHHLRALVDAGAVSDTQVDDAARRLLRTMLRFAASTTVPTGDVVASDEHRGLARRVAEQAMVILRNEPVDGTPVLPLDSGALHHIAVIGRLADTVNTGDAGSSDVRPPDVVTALAGFRDACDGTVTYDDGTDPSRAGTVAAAADVAVVVVGYTSADEGEFIDPSANPELYALFPPLEPDDPIAAELTKAIQGRGATQARGGDRARLTLRPADEELLLAVAAAQPRTVAVLVTGSAVVTEAWRAAVPAIVVAWYSGMEGGRALADILLGHAEPSGRLPCAFPVDERDLPPFDRHAHHVEYGLFHGQQHHDRSGKAPAYPLGWGLGYTTFRYGPAEVAVHVDHLDVSLDVTNTGTRPGAEVAQCYAAAPHSAVERPARWLVGFERVPIDPGATRRISIRLPIARLAYWDETRDGLVVEAGRYELAVAAHAADPGQVVSADLDERRIG
ncbi:MAG TPA: glycoside hydrolase family 3 N-terminal domain-containing protein [Acidimicrobiia bacterium]|nr:glycoside hydrolase family 3 N-terminal domain-containing protein [Acidimicrobiia bacterium]